MMLLALSSSSTYSETVFESQFNAPIETVNLQLKWSHQFQFAGYYAAKEKGFYKDVGLDVQIHEHARDNSVVSQVLSGQAEYGIGDSGIILDYANGLPIRALAAIFQHNPLVFISKQSSGIISPYEMAGKRIMLNSKSRDQAPLVATLQQAGITENDYTYIDNSYRNDDLIEDKVDVMIGYKSNEPFYFSEQNVGINVISPQSYGIDLYGDILFTSQQEIDNHPHRVKKFRRASLKGWQYALENPEEIIQLIHTQYGSQSSIEHLRYEARITRDLILIDSIPIGQIKAGRLRYAAETYTRLNQAKPLDEHEIKSFIYPENTHQYTLSEQEQKWLHDHPVIRIGIDQNFAPYEWIDDEGEYIGLAADFIHLIKQQLDIDVEIIQKEAWYEVLDLARGGELDMLSIAVKTAERESFLNFSSPYASSMAVIINRKSQGYIGNLSNLKGKRVAIQKGHYTQELLQRNHPNISVITTSTLEEALRKVSKGDADAYVGEVMTASYAMKKSGLANLQFAGQTDYQSEFRFAVNKEHSELLSIINKILAQLSQEEKNSIFNRWYSLDIDLGIQMETLIKYIIVIISLFLIIAYWLYRLQHEINHRKQAEKKLELSARVFSDTHEGITITDENQKIIDVNTAFCEITGYSLQEVIGKTPKILRSNKHSSEFYQKMWLQINDQGHWQGEVWNKRKNGEIYAALLTISSIADANQKVVNYVGVFSDITASKHQQEQFERMAHYDLLTGLPNRALFNDRFNQAIAHSKRNASLLAVCFLDLDNFKPVNDNFGHDIGDQLLIEVARRIKACIREEDTVSRQGGDEFALLLNNLTSFSQCEQTMERVHHSLAQAFVIGGNSHNITASSGITLFPLDEGDIDILLRHADQAMYEAKETGRNRYKLYKSK